MADQKHSVVEPAVQHPSTVAIPDGWRGPACAAFDEEMGKCLGDQGYYKASALASMLATFSEMSFEPSQREQAILDERKEDIAEAKQWVHDHVMLNPHIKKLMYETVRDLGRYPGDLEADEALRAYLAEMEGSVA